MMSGHHFFKHGLALTAFSAALFLPLIGRGFVHDDFMWLSNVAHQTRWYGLTHPTPTFYTPLTWLTFKLDWTLWGFRAWPMALETLLLHILNTLLLYRLAWHLWRSRVAAWWASFGFALLYMANSWAVMWISARTHLLATLFCLAAMLAAVHCAQQQQQRRKLAASVAVLVCCALSMLSKEIGVASVPAVLFVLWYVCGWRRLRDERAMTALLSGALLAVLCGYLALRAWAGALPVGADEGWYQYSFEFGVFFSNLREFLSRTYLVAGFLAGSIALSQKLRGARPRLNGVTRRETIFSALLFAMTIAPVILIRGRSGLYTYLPGIGAALLLGAIARAFYASTAGDARRQTLLTLAPVIFMATVLSLATVGQSLKWRTMAQTNMEVLRQIAAEQPHPGHGARLVLIYAKRDDSRRFPDGFGTWSFPFAVRLLYQDPTLHGEIVREQTDAARVPDSSDIKFLYLPGADRLQVIKR